MLGGAKGSVLVDDRPPVDQAPDDDLELLVIKRLLDKIVGAQAKRLTGDVDRPERRHQNYADVRVRRPGLSQQLDAVDVGHSHVRDDQVARVGGQVGKRRPAVIGRVDLVTLGFEDRLEHLAVPLFIVNDQ